MRAPDLPSESPRGSPDLLHGTQPVDSVVPPIQHRVSDPVIPSDPVELTKSTPKDAPNRHRNTSFSLFHEVITFPDGDDKHEILIHETITYPKPSSDNDSSKTIGNAGGVLSGSEFDEDSNSAHERNWIQQMFESKRTEIYGEFAIEITGNEANHNTRNETKEAA